MKIGIIGAENSHTAAIATAINIDKAIKGFTVDYVWGETEDFAKAAASKGQIGTIVQHPREMLGKIDAVICDHRHPKYHLKSVIPFIKTGIPAFIDKPLCYRAKEGHDFFKLVESTSTPVTSFSVLVMQKSFARFQKKILSLGKLRAVTFYGPADIHSPWGGIFFYGIHQVDLALSACGMNVNKVLMTKHGDNALAQFLYEDGRVVSLNFVKDGMPGFSAIAVGSEGTCHVEITPDKCMYLSGIRSFCNMFKTGKMPIEPERMLRPVEVLEALQRSQKSGRIEAV